uniref:C-type lectin domain-containing protein n=1 Tax=Oncorhynchus kisutch TaxID=8019 RepID=A0A8C7G5I1_ONCKI
MMYTILIFWVMMGEELSQNSCPMGWYDFNGRCYKYVATPLNWPESYCLTQGANLVSVHSEAEHQFIKILIQRFDPAERGTWMGLSDIQSGLHTLASIPA